ncbi:1356_t:CDS:2, partial [Funneliformis geosporum]
DYNSEESTIKENYAYIIDLDNISEQTKPAFCSIDAWKTIISSSNISTSLPSSIEEQIDNYLKDINFERIPFPSYIQGTHGFKLNIVGERFQVYLQLPVETLIYQKEKDDGSNLSQIVLGLLHPEGDKVKLDRCMIDVLNNLLEEYKTCEFTLAKEFKVFGFQIKDELIKSLGVLQRLKIAKARKPDPIDPVSSYILRLPPS